VTWDRTREAVEAMDVQKLRNFVAAELDTEGEPTLAFGHELVPESLKGIPKVRLVPGRAVEVSKLLKGEDLSLACLPLLDGPAGNTSGASTGSASSTAGSSAGYPAEVRDRFGWASGGAPKSVLHIVEGSTGVLSLCKQRKKGGQPLKISFRGDNLEDATRQGRMFCVACLDELPKEAIVFLKNCAPRYCRLSVRVAKTMVRPE